jgi:hypothetical protein
VPKQILQVGMRVQVELYLRILNLNVPEIRLNVNELSSCKSDDCPVEDGPLL